MTRIAIATLVLAAGFASPTSAANDWYIPAGDYWYLGGADIQYDVTPVGQAPDTIAGCHYGEFFFGRSDNGQFGNIYFPVALPLPAGQGYQLSFDIKLTSWNGYNLGLEANLRPASGPDGEMRGQGYDMGQFSDGDWHRVTITFDIPKGFSRDGGEYDFNAISTFNFSVFHNMGGGMGEDRSITWLVANVSFIDLDTGFDYAVNGDFSAVNENGTPAGWRSQGDFVTMQVLTGVPEPMTMSLLALGGLALRRRRR